MKSHTKLFLYTTVLVCNKIYLKAKRKSYARKINTNLHTNEIPKEGSQFICLSVILIDSVFRTGKNHCAHVLLGECKFVAKEKKMPGYITDDIEISSDSDRQGFDEILMKEILMKKIY